MTHTPGPWQRRTHYNCEIIARDNGGLMVLRAKAFGGSREEIDANARLIAAAPDMLAALKGAIEEWTDDNRTITGAFLPAYRNIQDAIAKAEGRTGT